MVDKKFFSPLSMDSNTSGYVSSGPSSSSALYASYRLLSKDVTKATLLSELIRPSSTQRPILKRRIMNMSKTMVPITLANALVGKAEAKEVERDAYDTAGSILSSVESSPASRMSAETSASLPSLSKSYETDDEESANASTVGTCASSAFASKNEAADGNSTPNSSECSSVSCHRIGSLTTKQENTSSSHSPTTRVVSFSSDNLNNTYCVPRRCSSRCGILTPGMVPSHVAEFWDECRASSISSHGDRRLSPLSADDDNRDCGTCTGNGIYVLLDKVLRSVKDFFASSSFLWMLVVLVLIVLGSMEYPSPSSRQ